jgi:hypothetical protein
VWKVNILVQKKHKQLIHRCFSLFSGKIADRCRPMVIGKDLFLPEDVIDLLTDVHPQLIDTIDRRSVQLHLDVQFLPEGIIQEVFLQFLDGDHLIPGEGHLRC